jgi:hypothetical protein
MKRDSLKQFVSLRISLTAEKAELEARLREIEQALGSAEVPAPKATRTYTKRKVTRARNGLSLKAAAKQVTAGKALTKQEILDAVLKLGYTFKSKNPLNSLGVVVYNKKQFKNEGGKFSPV